MRCYETRCANNDGEGYCEIDTSITIEQGGQCSNMWIPNLYPPKTDEKENKNAQNNKH